MEENKVILKLQEYIDLIRKVETLNQKLEEKDKNYIGMIAYIKGEVKKSENYRIISFDGKLDDTFTNKIANYHYKNILNSFLEKGLTFDLSLQLTDEVIKENKERKDE